MRLFALVIVAIVASADARGSPSALFDDDAVLTVTLTGPIQSVIKHKIESDEWPFVLEANGRQHAVHIRARGKSRLRLCRFPLLRLRFEDSGVDDSVFAGQRKLKLVTQCNENRSTRVDLLQEYSAYRIFNLLSEISYRVRLLHIKYIETEGRKKGHIFEHYAFLVESERELGERIGGTRIHASDVSLSALSSEQTARVFVFQYLIGNADFSLVTAEGADSCCHNGHLYDVSGKWSLVPIDFDLSGLVNARYARANPMLAVRRVRQRRYRGYCISTVELARAVSAIVAARAGVLRVIDEVPGLQVQERADSRKYLDKFFRRAQTPAKLLRHFEKTCLNS